MSSMDYKKVEPLLALKTATYFNNIYNVYCVDIYISKIIYGPTQ